jgi:hypothetical protein
MFFAGDFDGSHAVLRAHDSGTRAFADLTFGQVATRSNGVIQVPPSFAGFGYSQWPAEKSGDIWFAYGEAPEPPDMRTITAKEWSGLIDDLDSVAEIAFGHQNDEQRFVAEMERQMFQLGR